MSNWINTIGLILDIIGFTLIFFYGFFSKSQQKTFSVLARGFEVMFEKEKIEKNIEKGEKMYKLADEPDGADI